MAGSKRLQAVAIIGSLAGAPGAALAGPGQHHWYGWQILATGGTSFALVGAGAAIQDQPATSLLVGLGMAGYLLGGPINHWARGHTGRGFVSLGLDVGLPLAAGLIGGGLFAAADDGGGDVPMFPIGFAIGALAGAVGAIVVDAALLAHEGDGASSIAWGLSLPKGGLGLGVSGGF